MGNEEKANAIAFVIVASIVIIVIVCSIIFAPEPPPPKPIEQIREERKERFNEAGKAFHEFGRGLMGKEKTPSPAAK